MSNRRNLNLFKRKSREAKKIFLIVCEGTTEEKYFTEFRINKRLSSVTVDIIPSKKAGGTDSRTLVEFAIDKKRDNIYEHIWCVFDCDENKNIEATFQIAQKEDIQIAFSNPCFELWILLHYQDHRAFVERDKIIPMIKKYIKDYDKTMDGLYEKTKDKIYMSISRAEQLEEMHLKNCKEKNSNPSTSVYKLINSLNRELSE